MDILRIPEELTMDELKAMTTKLPFGKAPGPDGIPNEVLSRVARAKPQALLQVFNLCLRQSVFPESWKEARLVLLHKGEDKPCEEPSSFRPLSMLNTTGNTLE